MSVEQLTDPAKHRSTSSSGIAFLVGTSDVGFITIRSLPALQIGILQDTENGCDVVFVLFFRLPPNLDSGLTS